MSALAVGSGGNLRGIARCDKLIDTLVFLADLLDALSAGAGNGGGIAVVGVDTDEIGRHTVGLEASNDDVSWTSIVGAVTAGSVKFSNTNDSIVLDGDRSTSVVLDYLVRCGIRSTTLDENTSCSKSRNSILADITEPDVLQSASTLAVNTLKLFSTNDDVGDRGAIVKDEHGVGTSSIAIGACNSTVILLVAEVDAS